MARVSFQDLQNTIDKYLLLEDRYVVKLLCAFIVANRMPIPPPWLFIIASSSGGKSALLNSLANVRGFAPLDDMTANTFLSGMKKAGQETSFLHQLPTMPFIVMKDFTTILSKNKETKAAIMGLLRKIYDGEMSKRTGQGDKLDWEGKVGVLGGSTSSIHTKLREFSDMGERLLFYGFKQPDRRKLGEMILNKKIDDIEAKKAMREAFAGYLDSGSVNIPEEQPILDPETKKDLLDLSDLTTKARSAVERDEYSRDKRVLMVHYEEQVGRFLKQLMAMAYGLIVINLNETGQAIMLPEDRKALYGIALDSIPLMRRMVLQVLCEYDSASTKALGVRLGLPTDTVRHALEDLNAHQLVVKYEGMGRQDNWRLSNHWREIIGRFEGIKHTSKELEEPVAMAPDEESLPDIAQYAAS